MMAPIAAAHCGITFHTAMFSSVKTAFDVAVIREASVPAAESTKNEGACPVRWLNRSERTSPVTFTKVKPAEMQATRQKILSRVRRAQRKPTAHQMRGLCGPAPRTSTRPFSAYCVVTEQVTAPSTLSTISACMNGRILM